MSWLSKAAEIVKVGAPIALRLLADQVDEEHPTRNRHQLRSTWDTELANARYRLARRREREDRP